MRYRVIFPHIKGNNDVVHQMISFAELDKASDWLFKRCSKVMSYNAPPGTYNYRLVDMQNKDLVIRVQITVKEHA